MGKFLKKQVVLGLIFLLFTGFVFNHINVGGYHFEKPIWWKQVRVNLPLSVGTLEEVKKHIITIYGSDVGTNSTWKSALKCWVIFDKRHHHFPVYIGHCYKTGGELEKAVKVYIDLYTLANKQGEYSNWYKCYLAYNAGETYNQLKDQTNAKIWYATAASQQFLFSKDEAIKYYANDAMMKLKQIE